MSVEITAFGHPFRRFEITMDRLLFISAKQRKACENEWIHVLWRILISLATHEIVRSSTRQLRTRPAVSCIRWSARPEAAPAYRVSRTGRLHWGRSVPERLKHSRRRAAGAVGFESKSQSMPANGDQPQESRKDHRACTGKDRSLRCEPLVAFAR